MVLIPSLKKKKDHIDKLPNVYNNRNYSPKHSEKKMIYCQQTTLSPTEETPIG